ncbi:hypothetical protein HBN50_12870 [Halobacteriovorax sp. GB3]|uniref:hypothetical protein n=1 Tax=Halobacteriovorax sp. GB3 TaxID=2719615 RepID=UPI002361C11F|nr:hypothetical protein [Halobacteriovorax sp. GB3]MDD0853997.1 hypothetical protein [Halobacteriovorax sp. GB3]
MKKLILFFALLSSIFAQASELTLDEKASLWTLKIISESQMEILQDNVKKVQKIEEYYNSLGRFSFNKKRKLKAQNCGIIQSSVAANLIMLLSSFEDSKEALKKIDLTDEDHNEFTESFNQFIKSSLYADKKCGDIEKSSDAYERAYLEFKNAFEILNSYLPVFETETTK